jgi:hypothetical protein
VAHLQQRKDDLLYVVQILFEPRNVCLSECERSIIPSVAAFVLQFPVVWINRSECRISLYLVVAKFMRRRVDSRGLLGQISFYILNGGVELSGDGPIPKWIVKFVGEELVVLSLCSMLRRGGQRKLPFECKSPRLSENFVKVAISACYDVKVEIQIRICINDSLLTRVHLRPHLGVALIRD